MPKVKIKIVWQRKCNKNKKSTKYFIVVLGLTSGHASVTSMTVFSNQQSTTSGELTTDLSSPYITKETYSTYPPMMTSKVDLESATTPALPSTIPQQTTDSEQHISSDSTQYWPPTTLGRTEQHISSDSTQY